MSTATRQETSPKFTLAEFSAMAEAVPDRWLELINGRIEIVPPPDKLHQQLTGKLQSSLYPHHAQIAALGCMIVRRSTFPTIG